MKWSEQVLLPATVKLKFYFAYYKRRREEWKYIQYTISILDLQELDQFQISSSTKQINKHDLQSMKCAASVLMYSTSSDFKLNILLAC